MRKSKPRILEYGIRETKIMDSFTHQGVSDRGIKTSLFSWIFEEELTVLMDKDGKPVATPIK